MSDETGVMDPYEVVLKDLRAQRDRLDSAIKAIESVRGIPTAGSSTESKPAPVADATEAGAFLGMTVVDASKKLLAAKRKTMNNTEIALGLKAGGLVLSSAEPANTVGSILTRRFNEKGDVVRVGRGIWGLREWYPHTNFRKKEDAPKEAARAEQAPETEDVTREESAQTTA